MRALLPVEALQRVLDRCSCEREVDLNLRSVIGEHSRHGLGDIRRRKEVGAGVRLVFAGPQAQQARDGLGRKALRESIVMFGTGFWVCPRQRMVAQRTVHCIAHIDRLLGPWRRAAPAQV